MNKTRSFIYALIVALTAKALFELYLIQQVQQRTFPHCSVFVDNTSCTLVEWILNPGDIIVMLPAFIVAYIAARKTKS